MSRVTYKFRNGDSAQRYQKHVRWECNRTKTVVEDDCVTVFWKESSQLETWSTLAVSFGGSQLASSSISL